MTPEKNQTETTTQGEGMPAWVVPILSALGSMGGTYMIWVKPLQDGFKAMSEQIEELRDEIKLPKQQARREKEALNGIDDEEDENSLLQSRRMRPLQNINKKRNIISIR